MEISEVMATAEEWQKKESYSLGKEAFIERRFHAAADCYTRALELARSATLYSNRAQCMLNIKQWELALRDANEGLLMAPADEMRVKLLYSCKSKSHRRSSALEHLGETRGALRDAERAVSLAPSDARALAAVRRLQSATPAPFVPLRCVEKGDDFGGDETPLVEVEVEREEEEEKKEEMPSVALLSLSEEEQRAELPPPPADFVQFQRDYVELRRTPEAFAAYFLTIPRETFARIFSSLFQTDYLATLVEGALALLRSDPNKLSAVKEALLALRKLPRADMLFMMAGERETAGILEIAARLPAEEAEELRETLL